MFPMKPIMHLKSRSRRTGLAIFGGVLVSLLLLGYLSWRSVLNLIVQHRGGQLASQVIAEATRQNPLDPTLFETDPAVLGRIATGGRPLGRWTEGVNFEGMEPMPWLKSALNWVPRTEQVQPDEIRVTFMGTTPLIRPGQMGTSIFVELGSGKSFVFDLGPGSIANYMASGVPLNQINDIFLTHLHWDHYGSLPYVLSFGAWAGRWHEKLRVYGPSGRTPQHGTRYMTERMSEMLSWHRDNFQILPNGQGWDIDVHEFAFKDDGGVAYDKDGVKITHWRQSHASDGASAYRLDWNGMSIAFTGDGRPNALTLKYAQGVDLLITEIQPEIIETMAKALGALPFIARSTMDMGHNPAYAAGYVYNQLKPRLAMGTHVNYDEFSVAELHAEVRENWKGPFRLGAPDMVVVNMTRDKMWVRDGIVPRFPNIAPPQFDVPEHGALVVPAPKFKRRELQEDSIRDAEIKPELYYPKGRQPVLIEDWPTDKSIHLPYSLVPPNMIKRPAGAAPAASAPPPAASTPR